MNYTLTILTQYYYKLTILKGIVFSPCKLIFGGTWNWLSVKIVVLSALHCGCQGAMIESLSIYELLFI